jgi:hypothetical protein
MAPGQPPAGPDSGGGHLSSLAVALAGAELASPPDPGRLARLAWMILGELTVAAYATPGPGLTPAAVIAGAQSETSRHLAGLAADLAAAEAAIPPDQDRVAAVAWRILSRLGEVSWACGPAGLPAALAVTPLSPMTLARKVAPIERISGYQIRTGQIVPAQAGQKPPRGSRPVTILTWYGMPIRWSPSPAATSRRSRRRALALRGA